MLRANNPKILAALRACCLLLFLPAHLAFVLLIDLNFIPDSGGASNVTRTEDRGPDKERLRLHLHRQSEARSVSIDARQALIVRELHPWAFSPRISPESSPGESVSVRITQPAAIEIWLAATPQNHRAPPA